MELQEHLTDHHKSQNKRNPKTKTSRHTKRSRKIQTPEQKIHLYHHQNYKAMNFKSLINNSTKKKRKNSKST
jgi:hypothetical protein